MTLGTAASDSLLWPPKLPTGWHFVNLFYHEVESVFYCRLRHGLKVSDREVTGSGGTPGAALDAAIVRTIRET